MRILDVLCERDLRQDSLDEDLLEDLLDLDSDALRRPDLSRQEFRCPDLSLLKRCLYLEDGRQDLWSGLCTQILSPDQIQNLTETKPAAVVAGGRGMGATGERVVYTNSSSVHHCVGFNNMLVRNQISHVSDIVTVLI